MPLVLHFFHIFLLTSKISAWTDGEVVEDQVVSKNNPIAAKSSFWDDSLFDDSVLAVSSSSRERLPLTFDHRHGLSFKTRRLSNGMPNVCERVVRVLRRKYKVCRKSRPGPFITFRTPNCTGSEERGGDEKGCLRREQRQIYYDTLETVIVPEEYVEIGCCRGWYQLGSNDFGCPYRSCDNTQCGFASLCRPGIFSHRCRCRPGLQGKKCDEDVDECAVKNGGCQEKCQNTFGSYLCSCRAPKRLAPDGHRCIGESTEVVEIFDETSAELLQRRRNKTRSKSTLKPFTTLRTSTTTTTEATADPIRLMSTPAVLFYSCSLHNGGCAHICRRRQSYTSAERNSVLCDCFPGFQLAEDGRSCEDIDECLRTEAANKPELEPLRIYSFEDLSGEDRTNDQKCSQICRNTVGSYRCECYHGFELHSDAITCIQTSSSSDSQEMNLNSTRNHPTLPVSSRSGKLRENVFPIVSESQHRLIAPGTQPELIDNFEHQLEPLTIVEQTAPPSKCENDNGGCQQLCQDTPAGAVCSCRPGFMLDNNRTGCLDVDECGLGTHCCAEHCTNTAGSFKCSCRDGFRLSANGCGCVDVDECSENITVKIIEGVVTTTLPLCDHICVNMPGSYRCACRTGFKLSPLDRATCFRDMNYPQQDNNATASFQVQIETSEKSSSKIRIESIAFVPVLETAKTLCEHGRYGPNCSLVCGPCRHNASCDETSGECLCPKGTSGATCQNGCPSGMFGPPDCSIPCPSKCLTGECDPELGFCQCQPGYFGPNCAPCPSGRYGKLCEEECDCQFQHTNYCNATNGVCVCLPGYNGAKCEASCEIGFYGSNCLNACPGDCPTLCDPVSGQCPRFDCQNGFYGDDCSRPCPPGRYGHQCSELCIDCSPYGCDPSTGRCACPPGKKGPQCSQDCSFGFFGSDCGQRCNCSVFMAPLNGGGFQFSKMSSELLDSNHLESVGCNPATGVCYCPVGTFYSEINQRCEPCADGFYGVNCLQQCDCGSELEPTSPPPREYVPTPPANQLLPVYNSSAYFRQNFDNTSHFSKACDVVSGQCLCEPGYRGQLCDQPCAAGSYGRSCSRKCECGGNNDDCHPQTGECFCTTGWMGERCERPCAPGHYGPNCAQRCDCRNSNATCDRFLGTCICPPGYLGDTCEEQCKPGFHGLDCKQKCNCGYNNCHHVTGFCLESPSMEEVDVNKLKITPLIPPVDDIVTRNQRLEREKELLGVEQQEFEIGSGAGAEKEGTPTSPILIQETAIIDDGLEPTTSAAAPTNKPEDDDKKSREKILETMILSDLEQPSKDGTTAEPAPKLPPRPHRRGSSTSSRHPNRHKQGSSHKPHRDKSAADRHNYRSAGPVTRKTVAFAASREQLDARHFREIVDGEQMLMVANNHHQDGVIDLSLAGHNNGGCPPGYFGPACQDICPCHANGSCDAKGQCRCRPGYIGPLCEHACPKGYYGQDCRHRCRCLQNGSLCDHVTGQCDCAPGWTGRHCSKTCPPGSFGRNCAESCEDVACHAYHSAGCDRVTGRCICHSGYAGTQCADHCPDGTYGPRCALKCGCLNGGVCHHVTGCCDCREPGFVGALCEHECDSGFWGLNCNKSCSPTCRTNQCDRATGRCHGPPATTPTPRSTLHPGMVMMENNTDALLVGPAETSLSAESRRQARHFANGRGRYHSNSHHPRCEPYHFGPDCNLSCNCTPPPASRGCDRRSGRCRCQRGYMGPHCERHIDDVGLPNSGRADVVPNAYAADAAFDVSSSISSSTEQLLQQMELPPTVADLTIGNKNNNNNNQIL